MEALRLPLSKFHDELLYSVLHGGISAEDALAIARLKTLKIKKAHFFELTKKKK